MCGFWKRWAAWLTKIQCRVRSEEWCRCWVPSDPADHTNSTYHTEIWCPCRSALYHLLQRPLRVQSWKVLSDLIKKKTTRHYKPEREKFKLPNPYVNARHVHCVLSMHALHSKVGQSVTNSQNICLVKVLKLGRRCAVERGCPALAHTTNTKLHIAMPGMSNLQLFPVSSLLIGSTLLANGDIDGWPEDLQ